MRHVFLSLLLPFLFGALPLLGSGKVKSDYLPVIAICTKDKKVVKRQDYEARYTVIQNFKKPMEADLECSDENTESWGKFLMKPRGNSSYRFAKKQYRLKFEDEDGEDLKVSFGGMPKASKWVLHAPYVDKSLIRNLCAYELGREFGESRGNPYFAPKALPYEVYLNGEYQGLYLMLEKIERGNDKVDFPKLAKQKKHNFPFLAEISAKDGDFKTKKRTRINYRYPSPKKLEKLKVQNPEEAEYIRSTIVEDVNSFEFLLSDKKRLTKTLKNPDQNILDVDSFVDYILLQEVFKNVDGYRRSAYFQKLEDGRMRMGPLWDYNLALGNLSFYFMEFTEGWLYKVEHGYYRNSFWFKTLIKNPVFEKKLRERFLELRAEGGLLSESYLMALVEKQARSLKGSPARDSEKWKKTRRGIEHYIFNTKEEGETTEEHTQILKDWLKYRVMWMEHNIYAISI